MVHTQAEKWEWQLLFMLCKPREVKTAPFCLWFVVVCAPVELCPH